MRGAPAWRGRGGTLAGTTLTVALLVACACAVPRAAGAPPCPTERTVTITSQDDVDRLAGCVRVSGLVIRSGAPLGLAPLRALEVVTGDLVVGPTLALEELTLLELVEVRGAIRVTGNHAMRGLFLPRLERAGRIEVEASPALVTISLPRLGATTGSLVVSGNTSLEIMDLSALVSVGKDLVVTANPRLTLIEAGRLEAIQTLRIEDNRALPAEQIDALRARTPSP